MFSDALRHMSVIQKQTATSVITYRSSQKDASNNLQRVLRNMRRRLCELSERHILPRPVYSFREFGFPLLTVKTFWNEEAHRRVPAHMRLCFQSLVELDVNPQRNEQELRDELLRGDPTSPCWLFLGLQ